MRPEIAGTAVLAADRCQSASGTVFAETAPMTTTVPEMNPMRLSTRNLLSVFLAAGMLAACGEYAAMDSPPMGYPTSGSYGEPERSQGDRYAGVGTNPFVVTEHDPLSTFAIDVDTASYDIFRRDVEQGVLPQKDSVRVEEYVNFFPYGYGAPEPEGEVPFVVTTHVAVNPFGESAFMRVGLKGKELLPGTKKAAHIVFLIDTSGSMSSAAKLPLVKTLLNEAVDTLDPDDLISITTYAGGVRLVLEPTPAADKSTIKAAINNLRSGGSTAGSAGLDLAYEQAEKAFIEGGINHVILCTDGDFNVGPSSDDALLKQIEEKRETGITLTVFGFGSGNLNDSMMEKVSNAGNGTYAVISSADQAIHHAHHRLIGSVNIIAKDVKVQIEFNPTQVLAYRLIGYENRALEDDQFKDDTVDAGEVGAGHTVTALYELILVGGAIPQPSEGPEALSGTAFDGQLDVLPDDFALVKLRYKDLEASTEDPAQEVHATAPAALLTDLGAADGDFQWAVAIAAFAEIVKDSPFANVDALAGIDEVLKANAGDDPERTEFLELFATARSLLEQ